MGRRGARCVTQADAKSHLCRNASTCVTPNLVCGQVVVVSSGTNDWHSLPPLYSLKEWVSKGVAFLREVGLSAPPQSRLAFYVCGREPVSPQRNHVHPCLAVLPCLPRHAAKRLCVGTLTSSPKMVPYTVCWSYCVLKL